MSRLAAVRRPALGYLLREPIRRLVGRLGDKLLDVASDDPSAGRLADRPGGIRTRS
jgi:hypothetical protein